MTTFEATHLISHKYTASAERLIPVQVVDGVCYTEAEWDSADSADWELSAEGLTFQGKVPIGTSSIEAIADRCVVRYCDPGMVLGEGPTEEAAWAEARQEYDNGAGGTHWDEQELECAPYDPRTYEVRMFGRIVCLVAR